MNALIEWLGAGGVPVSQGLAESRARVCQSCPENVQPGWWDRVKGHIAEAIKRHLSAKNELHISVPNEDKLAMCRVCGCCVPLKVHVPIAHINSGNKGLKWPDNCWIPKETNELL